MEKRLLRVFGPLAGLFAPAMAMAADPWAGISSLSISTAPYVAGIVVILTALASIWIGRKLIKLWNKS